jgi:hypothetical protein
LTVLGFELRALRFLGIYVLYHLSHLSNPSYFWFFLR